MNQQQLKRMTEDKGFIAALDQSGGSTPKALKAYGVDESAYSGEEEMFTRVHEMRTRIIKSPSFDKSRILAAILFENTMDRKIDSLFSADFLWNQKGIVPILKVDKGLADEKDGVQLMKPIPGLDELLDRAAERGAERCLAHLGLENGHAAKDIRELRDLLEAWRDARRTAWQTAVKVVTTGILAALLIGAAIKLKLMGGAQ